MSGKLTKIVSVPTNIITGFLGVGKTTAILHLLKHKPNNERWAVLVNEFGEIGIDGSLFKGQHSEQNGVFVREVPGGCMCCTAGLPMQIALAQLLNRAKPDRLLIEPTGLGHPIEVLQTLFSEYYRETLAIQKIITLVDARKLADKRYTENDIFNQQIEIADIIVGNKQDLYGLEDKTKLISYINDNDTLNVKFYFAQQAMIEPEWLIGKTDTNVQAHNITQIKIEKSNLNEPSIPECGYIKAINQGEGFISIGWRFDETKTFNRNMLCSFMNGLSVERLKAVFITKQGVYGYNLANDSLTEIILNDCLESRIEIIATTINNAWEGQLLACIDKK